MNPRLRLTLFLILGTALAIFIGVDLANESYALATLAALVCCWIFVEWKSVAPPDAWLLAAAVVGYIVGNRGFAQIQPAANIPLLPAEAVLLAAVPALAVRVAMKRAIAVRKDFLNYAILVWMVIGTARLPVDLSIALLAVVLAVLIGGTAGTVAAVKRGSWFDRGVTIACSVVSTLPAFVVGIILVVLFAVSAHLLPASGYTPPSAGIGPWLEHIILPALALALQVAADIARQLRTSLVSVLDQNYIVGARVRGLPYRRVLVRHALRNASGPALTILGNDFPIMLAGAVAAEVVFSLPGLGQLLLAAAEERDIPVVQGVLLVVATFVIVVNLVVNTLLAWLNRSADGVSA